jgi:hypothetical protein
MMVHGGINMKNKKEAPPSTQSGNERQPLRGERRKPKFKVGQVVAHCYDFKDGDGEFVKDYCALSKMLCEMVNQHPVTETPLRKVYYRALNAKEQGR